MNSKCYTFYSYKGGSGRTTTLLNTTKHLAEILNASKEHPILLVDADLESAGLTYFFGCEKKFSTRFNSTLNAEDFINSAPKLLKTIRSDNTFGISKERLVSCEAIATRIGTLHKNIDTETLLSGVYIRETTSQILERIVRAKEFVNERNKTAQTDEDMKTDDDYLNETYDFRDLFDEIEIIEQTDDIFDKESAKRAAIENFLPTDGMVDVSDYFGRHVGSVKFIGVDVAFKGVHVSLTNEQALNNKSCIAFECGKKGFSTVIFDCGAGVQSTAHILNHVSDVIVYCMRPTFQFASGTINQLNVYYECLSKIANRINAKALDNGEEACKKPVILLPTAVPYSNEGTENLQKDSFKRIENIANIFSKLIDDTFCSYETSLKEVSLFKWREHILGTRLVGSSNIFEGDCAKTIEPYENYNTMPDDAKFAYKTYRLLAERLCFNS